MLVRAFLARWGCGTESDIEACRSFLATDVYWHTGTRACDGLQACVSYLHEVSGIFGVTTTSIVIVHQAERGNVVLNERIDTLHRADGTVIADLRLMGVFEVAANRIIAWRDYFDPTELRQLTGN